MLTIVFVWLAAEFPPGTHHLKTAPSQADTLVLAWDRWRQPAADTPYWDLHQDGWIDAADLVYYRDTYFEEVTLAAGIQTTHHEIADYFSIGQAWGDFDRDGWPDLYLTDNDGANSLWHNQGDGTFALAPLAVGLSGSSSAGAVFADYDNDGWPDLYVLNNGPNTLFHNEGGGGFTDVTAAAGVGDTGRGETAAWGDFNRDGRLDLYVTNWGEPGIFEDRLYLNNGDGTFADISAVLGPRVAGAGFVASFVDYDNDQDLDIYLVNDKLLGNVLWRNDDPSCVPGCFTEISAQSGADIRVFGMGLATGDYDGDLDLDFYFSHIGPMVLLQNQTSQGNPVFVEAGVDAGVAFDCIGWGTVFMDVDNDGWLDLYLAVMDADPLRANRLFRNLGDGTFADETYRGGAANMGPSLGVAYADYDRDGFLDLAVGNYGRGYHLYRNRGRTAQNNWLNVKLVGAGPINRDAIGARVYLTLSDGRILLQEVKCGSSLGAGNDLALHFGLGSATINKFQILWPNGQWQSLVNPTPNQFLYIDYPFP